MATGVVWSKFEWHHHIGRSWKPPSRCKNLGRISCKSWVIADFLLKIANFRCHGNKDMSDPNVTGIVELADPENHTIEPKIRTLSYTQPKLWQILWWNSNFSLPWQQGSSEQSLTDTIKLAYPEPPPSRCKNLGRISCTSWVTVNFVLKIANFRCHGNKGMS